MSDVAKKARAAMKAKAQRLGADRPLEKVDSSTFTPPELLNADVKTGMRPISRRAFKKGGKVMGECAPARADRAPRKSGGKAITADSLINRNQKEANESREGIKHVGGMKKGGRANREEGGKVEDYDTGSRTGAGAVTQSRSKPTPPMPQRRPPPADYDTGSRTGANAVMESRKSGGRTKKMGGGGMGPAMSGSAKMIQESDRGVPSDTMNFTPVKSGRFAKAAGLKKGGSAGHEDVAADKKLIKKMVKSEARTGKTIGGAMSMFSPLAMGLNAMRGDDDDDKGGKKHGGRTKRATGGGIFSGPGYPGKVPGATGGRTAHAAGGKTKGKGKTAINIVINAGKSDDDSMMPPNPMGAPKGMPIPLPPAGAGMPPGAAPPMPMPPPGMMGAGGPPGTPPMPPGGMPPMGRKAGGRTYRSYKDMDAGAGSGMGRLEKSEIEEHKRGERKAGGRTYRSYKDMDAGSGGGFGRIEKAEIASRKSRIDGQNY
tara:strand:+ start:2972 stop:4429 length:1458 start_codon:yes stop_codon:yes gene_type:complete